MGLPRHARSGQDLLRRRVPRQVFELLVSSWPDPVANQQIAEALGIDPGVSTLRTALSRLRTMGVASGNAANDDLMQAVQS